MLLDLSQLGRHGRGVLDEHIERSYDPSAFTPAAGSDEGFAVVEPVRLVVDLHKDREAYRLRGRVQTTLQLECSRCLEPFLVPVDNQFELRYVAQEQANVAAEREIQEDDLITSHYRGDMLDLGEVMREQFHLALPMKPLCKDDCKGICPDCGTNLNTGTCGCAHEWTDQRMAALKGLLDRKTE